MKSAYLRLALGVLLALGLSIPSFATVEDAIHKPSTSTRSRVYYGYGGYDTDTEIVDRQQLYTKKRFTRQDFRGWLSLLHHAMALQTLTELQAGGEVSMQAEVLGRPLTIGRYQFPSRRLIDIHQLRKAVSPLFTDRDLWQELVASGVMSEDGFILGLDDQTANYFRDVDFQVMRPGFDEIVLPIADERLEQGLKRELFHLITLSHQVNQITTVENTYYRSANTNLFENLFETLIGNAIGRLIFPTRATTTQVGPAWAHRLAVSDYFPQMRLGFNNAPFHRGGKGLVVMNGKPILKSLEVNRTVESNVNVYSGRLRFRQNKSAPPYTSGQLGYLLYGVDVDAFDELGTVPLFVSPIIGFGAAGQYTDWRFFIGPTFKDGKTTPNAIGVTYGLGFVYYPSHPLSFRFSILDRVQPNFISGDTEWRFSELDLGASLHFDRLGLQGGHRWYFTENETLVANWYWGVKLFF